MVTKGAMVTERERPVLNGRKKKVGGGRCSYREDAGDKDEKAGEGG